MITFWYSFNFFKTKITLYEHIFNLYSKNSESLYCAVPAGNTGSADVQVHIDGNAVEKKIPPNAFKYVDDPTISEIDPLKSIQR